MAVKRKTTSQRLTKKSTPVLSTTESVKPNTPNTLLYAVLGVATLGILVSAGLAIFMFTRVQNLEEKLADTTPASISTTFTRYAKKLGLNEKQFQSCLDSSKYAQVIQNDLLAGQQAGVSGTPTLFVNGYPVVGAQPYQNFKTAIDQELARIPNQSFLSLIVPEAFAQVLGGSDQGAGQLPQDATATPTPTPARVNVDTGHLPVLGNKNAKITLVEFSDFQCPFCEQLFTTALPQIKKDYVDTGKAKLAFRHYPLPFHQNAQKAAEAAECANEQGKFWEMHDQLFQTQKNWENITPSAPQ